MSKTSEPESLETYLAQIAHELRDLPAQARADELREIESHLRTMIEQRGDVAATLAQFGKPRKVGRDLRRAWERKQPESWWRVVMALFIGLAMWSVFGIITKEFYTSYLAYYGIDMIGAMAGTSKPTGLNSDSPAIFATMVLYLRILGIFYTAAIGYVSGLISPKRGIITAWSVMIVLAVKEIVVSIHSPIGFDAPSAVIGTAVNFAFSFVLVSAGAYFGARFSQKRRARIAK